MTCVSLLGQRTGSQVVAVRGSACVRVDDYLSDVARLASLLPDRKYVVNLYSDRYEFAVGLAAAMWREQICLLPPAQTPQLLSSLAQRYPGLYALCDDPDEVPLDCVAYPATDAAPSAPACEPSFPAEQIAAIAFTSGSTGEPTPHVKTWGHLIAGASTEASRFGLRGALPITVVGTVPAQHMYGFESTVLMALHNGLILYAGRPFYPADVR